MRLTQHFLLISLAFSVGCSPSLSHELEEVDPIEAAQATPAPETTPPAAPSDSDDDGDGFSLSAGDCDDHDASIHPEAPELCGDKIDNNCDRFIDEPSALDAAPYFLDEDGDGFGDPARYLVGCSPHPGFVAIGEDCDDQDPEVNPEAEEYCGDKIDFNCDGRLGGPRAEDSQVCLKDTPDSTLHPSPLGGQPIKACECPPGYSPLED